MAPNMMRSPYSVAMVVALVLVLVLSYESTLRTSAGCLGDLTSKFKTKSSYERLANYLYEATPSSELADNTRLGPVLMSEDKFEKASDEFKALVSTFVSLNDSTPPLLCRRWTLHNLHLMAETMRRHGGDLAKDQRTPEPVRRLNRILIKLILKAYTLCFGYLETKWRPNMASEGQEEDKAWEPRWRRPETPKLLAMLDKLPDPVLFRDYPGVWWWPMGSNEWDKLLADQVSRIVATGQMFYSRSPTSLDSAWTRDTLVGLIKRFIHEPCSELAAQHEARAVLEPYLDLLMSSFIVRPWMDEFYQNSEARPRWRHDPEVLTHVRRLRACSLLGAMDQGRLAELAMSVRHSAVE